MKLMSRGLALCALVSLAACSGAANSSLPATPLTGGTGTQAQMTGASGPTMFGHYLRHAPQVESEATALQAGKKSLPLWKTTFTYKGKSYTYTMVGTDPSKGSASTTVPVIIVPLKFTYADGSTFDATQKTQTLPVSASAAFTASPFFKPIDFTVGGTDLGNTQFIDAFQRGNFWSDVSTTSPNYHVLLGSPKVMPGLTIAVPANKGKVHTLTNGIKYADVDPTTADNAALAYIKATRQINPSMFVVFLTYNVEIGGGISFHSSFGSQTYTITMFNDPGVLSALSQQFASVANVEVSTHEVGEWMDDPFGQNVTPGFGILEVGDPLDGNHLIVQLGGLQYNLQELAFHDYFTCKAPPSTSVNGWYSFLGKFRTPSSDC